MRTLNKTLGGAFLMLTMTGAALADETGDALKNEVIDAYKNAKTHQSTVQMERVARNYGWTLTQSGEFKVAFDRETQRLRVLTPELEVAVGQGKLFAKSEMVASRHLEVDAPTPLDYSGLTGAVRYLKGPVPVPELAFLLADDPFTAIGDGGGFDAKALGPDGDDPLKRERLELTSTREKTTLWVDPSTRLVSEMLVEPFGEPGKPTQSEKYHFKFTVEKHDQPLEGAVLAFDPAGTDAAGSIEEWIKGPKAGNPLIGKNAPEIEAKTLAGEAFKLSAVKQKVVVLDFWATWCGPCVMAMPGLQKVHEWIAAEKKDAVIYPVNLGEPTEKVKPFWEEKKFTMTTVLDTEQKSGEPYGIQGIPMTVVISSGKVRHVHIGFDRGMEEKLKKEIDALLSEGQAK
jgi:thiol-disulfide isomerase/thioredoxin